MIRARGSICLATSLHRTGPDNQPQSAKQNRDREGADKQAARFRARGAEGTLNTYVDLRVCLVREGEAPAGCHAQAGGAAMLPERPNRIPVGSAVRTFALLAIKRIERKASPAAAAKIAEKPVTNEQLKKMLKGTLAPSKRIVTVLRPDERYQSDD